MTRLKVTQPKTHLIDHFDFALLFLKGMIGSRVIFDGVKNQTNEMKVRKDAYELIDIVDKAVQRE